MKQTQIPTNSIVQVTEVAENVFNIVYLERGQIYLTEAPIEPEVIEQLMQTNPRISIQKLDAEEQTLLCIRYAA